MGKWPLFLHRIAHFLYGLNIPIFPMLLVYLNRVLFACFIGPGASIGKHVIFGYGGLGVVIHNDAVIGDNVRIGSGVTIGGRSKQKQVPVIGSRCIISTGAKLLGPITIGDECVVGANAVVIKSALNNSVIAGVPARIIKRNIVISDYHDNIA